MHVTGISEAKFAEICDGIRQDRDLIIKHNPIGPDEEILFWMLLSCLISYLSLTEQETPCFTGKPDAGTYRNAILFVLGSKMEKEFDAGKYLDRLIS